MAMKLLTELTDWLSHKMFGVRHKQIRDKRTFTPLNGITLEISTWTNGAARSPITRPL
jgi:hypothetical protein